MNSECDLVFLVTVSNVYEFSIVKGILEKNHILYLTKDEGVGDFLRISTGSILNNVHVFVHKLDFEKSKHLLESMGFKIENKEKNSEF